MMQCLFPKLVGGHYYMANVDFSNLGGWAPLYRTSNILFYLRQNYSHNN